MYICGVDRREGDGFHLTNITVSHRISICSVSHIHEPVQYHIITEDFHSPTHAISQDFRSSSVTEHFHHVRLHLSRITEGCHLSSITEYFSLCSTSEDFIPSSITVQHSAASLRGFARSLRHRPTHWHSTLHSAGTGTWFCGVPTVRGELRGRRRSRRRGEEVQKEWDKDEMGGGGGEKRRKRRKKTEKEEEEDDEEEKQNKKKKSRRRRRRRRRQRRHLKSTFILSAVFWVTPLPLLPLYLPRKGRWTSAFSMNTP